MGTAVNRVTLNMARKRRGFTLIELAVVLAIITVMAGLATSATSDWFSNLRVRSSAQLVDAAFAYARSEAIRSGRVHLVFLMEDTQANPLLDVAGDTVPILIVNDGLPGTANQNCKIDPDETVRGLSFERDVSFGVTSATAGVPNDSGTGDLASGVTFDDGAGNDVLWTLFRPEGTTVAFAADCSMGAIGSGAGGVYLTNGIRDFAVVVTPLGASRVHVYDGLVWSD
jgi:prepilin-type N-terminal cleavage/methylation domain-containing protein